MIARILVFFGYLFTFWRKVAPIIADVEAARTDIGDAFQIGRRAEALRADPLLNSVFESVANRYRLAWENAPRGDLEAQRVAHLSLAALKDVQGAIVAHLGNAKILEAELKAREARERARSSPLSGES